MRETHEFTCTVDPSGHEWFELPEGETDRARMFIAARNVTSELRQYAPLRQFPGLHRTFCATEPQPSGIDEFADQYGLLGGSVTKILPHGAAPYVHTEGEFLDDWCDEIGFLRKQVNIWDEYLSARSSDFQPRVIEDVAGVQAEVNRRLAIYGAVPRLALDASQGNIRGVIVPGSLLGAIWVDFYLAISSGKGLAAYKKCESCGRFFEKILSRRRDALYCSDACKSKAYRRRVE